MSTNSSSKEGFTPFRSWNTIFNRTRAIGQEIWDMQPTARFTQKADGTMVCNADIYASQALRELLATELPGVPYICEEEVTPEDLLKCITSEDVVVNDPLDGTRQFKLKLKTWSVSMGFLRRRIPIGGVVIQPALMRGIAGFCDSDIQWFSDTTAGEWQAYERARGLNTHVGIAPTSSKEVTLREQNMRIIERVVMEFGTYSNENLADAPSAHSIMDVIAGDSMGCIICARAKAWDLAGGTPFLRRIGGVVRHVSGKDVSFCNLRLNAEKDPIICAESEAVYQHLSSVIRPIFN